MRKIGQTYRHPHNEDLYLVVTTPARKVFLANLKSGKPFSMPVKVFNHQEISEDEWREITDDFGFELCLVSMKRLDIEDSILDDIMVTALEGGINYWAGKCQILERGSAPENSFASDVISKGGKLRIYDAESSDSWDLDRQKLENGIKLFKEQQNDFEDGSDLDASDADLIVQYALFENIVFC